MNFIVENWYIIVAVVVAVIVLGFAIYGFFKKSKEEQIKSLKEWLKYAVTVAEAELGSGTGQLKLRFVYDLFVSKFSWLSKFISFGTFSFYVDEALEWLNSQLSSNENIALIVKGTTESEEV